MKILARMFFGDTVSSRSISELEESTFVEVKNPMRQYTSYAWRIILSAIIATGGIAVSSPAVIIGAMLVAPLMSPMLGTTFALVSSNWRGVLRTFLVTILGSLACIVVAVWITALMPVSIEVTTNPEVVSRVSPRVADLTIALASGLMAAIALMRDDIPDALAGVAIAASLVPPLCVVGIAFYYRAFPSALGALNLFLVNYFAIQVMGLLVFFVSDLRKKARDSQQAMTRRAKIIMAACIVGALCSVSIPLAQASREMMLNNELTHSVSDIAEDWLLDSDFRVKNINVSSGRVTLTIAGEGEPPSTKRLQSALAAQAIPYEDLSVTVLRELTFSHP